MLNSTNCHEDHLCALHHVPLSLYYIHARASNLSVHPLMERRHSGESLKGAGDVLSRSRFGVMLLSYNHLSGSDEELKVRYYMLHLT